MCIVYNALLEYILLKFLNDYTWKVGIESSYFSFECEQQRIPQSTPKKQELYPRDVTYLTKPHVRLIVSSERIYFIHHLQLYLPLISENRWIALIGTTREIHYNYRVEHTVNNNNNKQDRHVTELNKILYYYK